MLCIEEKHQRHAIVAIERKYIECEDRLNDLATKLEKQIMRDLESNLDTLQKEIRSCEYKFVNVVGEVNGFRQKLKDAVDKSCDKLVAELDRKAKECMIRY